MSMGIGTNAQNPDEGELTRELEQIACGVWFTSTGRTIPQMVKYQDGEGLIHRITHIQVQTQAEKYYCCIPLREFCCSTIVENQEYESRLYYYPQTHCWTISWEEE